MFKVCWLWISGKSNVNVYIKRLLSWTIIWPLNYLFLLLLTPDYPNTLSLCLYNYISPQYCIYCTIWEFSLIICTPLFRVNERLKYLRKPNITVDLRICKRLSMKIREAVKKYLWTDSKSNKRSPFCFPRKKNSEFLFWMQRALQLGNAYCKVCKGEAMNVKYGDWIWSKRHLLQSTCSLW